MGRKPIFFLWKNSNFWTHFGLRSIKIKFLGSFWAQIIKKKISKEFKDIKWYYKNAKDAANLQLELKKMNRSKFYLKIMDKNRLLVKVDKKIFGRTPFLCQKINDKKVNELSLNILGKQKWISPPLNDYNNKKWSKFYFQK